MSNYNNNFVDIMDNINNIAQGYGYKNGIHWADERCKKGSIDYGTFKQYENAHNLRVRLAHGNARDISVSYETYQIVRKWENEISKSNARKYRSNDPINLPAGAYRYTNKPFTKEFNITGKSGKNYYFRFEIVKEYQKRAYDDGTRFEGTGYTIYVKESPYKDWCIEHNSECEFHFYACPVNNPSICWNNLITDFQAANAVMIVWVKRYCKILDQILVNGNLDINRIERRTRTNILPTGTFRSRKSSRKVKTIYIDKDVYENIMNILGTRKPELGGMLGWIDDQNYIDYFVFDDKAKVGSHEYNPNTEYLSSIINGSWKDNHIYLGGFVHSHPGNAKMLSSADVEYAQEIMKVFDIEYMFMPIVTSSYEHKTTFNPYIVTADGQVQKCKIELTERTEFSDIDESMTELLKSIENGFDNMKGISPVPVQDDDSIFARISNVIDIDYMNECTIIGIGCGGSRSFYESMARVGVGNFYLMDGDKSSYSNIASQNGYISEVGMFKPEVIKQRLLDINPDIKVKTFNHMLDDNYDDEYLEMEIISKIDPKKTVLCAFTDDFYAQARISRMALKYKIPFVCGQHHKEGMVSELIFWYPDVTKYSLREIARTRYQAFENGYKNDVTSLGSPIFNTTRLNALCEKIVTGMLLFNNYPNHIYSKFLTTKCDMNLILIKQRYLTEDHPLYTLFDDSLNNFFDEVVWVNPEAIENLDNVVLEENDVKDTRKIF